MFHKWTRGEKPTGEKKKNPLPKFLHVNPGPHSLRDLLDDADSLVEVVAVAGQQVGDVHPVGATSVKKEASDDPRYNGL